MDLFAPLPKPKEIVPEKHHNRGVGNHKLLDLDNLGFLGGLDLGILEYWAYRMPTGMTPGDPGPFLFIFFLRYV